MNSYNIVISQPINSVRPLLAHQWNTILMAFHWLADGGPLLDGQRREKTFLRGFANNTGADQPAHPRSLISTFVIRFLESNKCKLAPGEISVF